MIILSATTQGRGRPLLPCVPPRRSASLVAGGPVFHFTNPLGGWPTLLRSGCPTHSRLLRMSGRTWLPELVWGVRNPAHFFLTESRVSHTFAKGANVWGTRGTRAVFHLRGTRTRTRVVFQL